MGSRATSELLTAFWKLKKLGKRVPLVNHPVGIALDLMLKILQESRRQALPIIALSPSFAVVLRGFHILLDTLSTIPEERTGRSSDREKARMVPSRRGGTPKVCELVHCVEDVVDGFLVGPGRRSGDELPEVLGGEGRALKG